MPKTDKPFEAVTVRLPPEMIARLPAPSLEGHRAEFIREAIAEKMAREYEDFHFVKAEP